jgi:hypothetical protein
MICTVDAFENCSSALIFSLIVYVGQWAMGNGKWVMAGFFLVNKKKLMELVKNNLIFVQLTWTEFKIRSHFFYVCVYLKITGS